MSAGETTSSDGAHTHTGPSHSHGHNLAAGAHTLSTSEMPSHSHSSGKNYVTHANPTAFGPGGVIIYAPNYNATQPQHGNAYNTGSAGSGSSHSHSTSGNISADGTGNTGSNGAHTHTLAAPQYIDVIICSKDA